MGDTSWSHMLLLTYSLFVVVTNTSGWPLVLDGGVRSRHPEVTFDQPKLGLRFKRIGNSRPGFVTTIPVPLDEMYASSADRCRKTFTKSADPQHS